LAWEPPSFDGGSEIKGYYIERSSGYSSRFVKVNRDPIARTQQTFSDLVEGTEYEYRVLAENEAGISKPSETTGVFVAKDPYGKPGKPGTPTVKDVSKGSVTIEWEAPASDGGAEITDYVVEVSQAHNQLCLINIKSRDTIYTFSEQFERHVVVVNNLTKNQNSNNVGGKIFLPLVATHVF